MLLCSLHRDSDKKKMFCCCYYAHYAMIMTKNQIVFYSNTTLHNYHEDKILFCYCYYVTMPWPRQKINLFSFQHYFHYIIVMRIKLLHNNNENKTAVFFAPVSSVFLKDSYIIQWFHRQEFQWSLSISSSGSSVFLKDSYMIQ